MRALGHDFQCWRAAWELEAEAASNGYEEERADFADRVRPPTFKDYLIQMTGAGWPMSGQAPARRFAA